MADNLNLSNNKIINVGAATSDKDALSGVAADGRYLKLAGGTVAGHVFLNNNILASKTQALKRTGMLILCKSIIHMFIIILIWSIIGSKI